MKINTIALLLISATVEDGFSQEAFQNLNFEAADVAGYAPNSSTVPTSSAFPGWQAIYGANPPSAQVWYDGLSIGGPMISILDNKAGSPIQGNYSADLFAAVVGTTTYSVTLSQTGVVPASTESIEMDANQAASSSFVVTLGGEPVNMVPLQRFANYTLWGGDASAFAGQDVALSITELPPANQEYSPSLLELDNITFSQTTVTPEPGTLSLLVVGATAFAVRSWWKRVKASRQKPNKA